MRQLLPDPLDDVDPVRTYLAAPRPAPAGRPWVTVGMIQSLDGATAVDGRSGGLGGPADKAVFRAVRGIADVILVAAGTVRAEGYGPVRLPEEIQRARREAGRTAAAPRLAVVTASLDLDPHAALFEGDGEPPVVLTVEDADPARRRALDDVADVRAVGRGRVDLPRALASLAADGVGVVVCEGGPSLNGAIAEAGTVDEWCVSVAPVVAGGDSRRLTQGAAPIEDGELELAQLLLGDGILFGRWVRAGARPGT